MLVSGVLFVCLFDCLFVLMFGLLIFGFCCFVSFCFYFWMFPVGCYCGGLVVCLLNVELIAFVVDCLFGYFGFSIVLCFLF